MFELKHVPLDEGLSDLFVGPSDEHFVVVVGLFGQADAEEDGNAEVHPFPVRLKQYAQLLKKEKKTSPVLDQFQDGCKEWS